jgi:L-seryl-tRNA(Ser) seleniumtransferase
MVSSRLSADDLASRLRAGVPPVVGRIQGGRLLLDLRAIEEEDEAAFVEDAIRALEGAPS